MAKSIRSKWRRKCRAVKRERYGAKELARLKKTLGIDENAQGDVEMPEVSVVTPATDASATEQCTNAAANPEGASSEQMDEDGKRIFNKKTLRDQFGNYPIWMSSRKIVKVKKGRAKTKKATFKATRRRGIKQKKRTKGTVNQESTKAVEKTQ